MHERMVLCIRPLKKKDYLMHEQRTTNVLYKYIFTCREILILLELLKLKHMFNGYYV